MHHITIVEATEHMNNSIGLANICKELISKTLSLRGALDQSCDVNYLDCCRDNTSWMNQFSKFIKTLIWHCDHTYVRFDSAKREIGCLCFCT